MCKYTKENCSISNYLDTFIAIFKTNTHALSYLRETKRFLKNDEDKLILEKAITENYTFID